MTMESSIEMLVVTLLFDGETTPNPASWAVPHEAHRNNWPDRNPVPSVLKKNRGDVLCRSVLSLSFDVVVTLLFDGESTPNPISRAVPHEAHRNYWSDRNPVPSVLTSSPGKPHLSVIANRGWRSLAIRSFPSSSSLLRLPRRSSGIPEDSFVSPSSRELLFRLLRDPEGFFFPDLSGTFFSPSSDELKQGGRKRSIQLARGKLKNFLVSNNHDKPARICSAK